MTVNIKWSDGQIDTYANIDSINKEGNQIVLISGTDEDVYLWAAKIESIEVGGIN